MLIGGFSVMEILSTPTIQWIGFVHCASIFTFYTVGLCLQTVDSFCCNYADWKQNVCATEHENKIFCMYALQIIFLSLYKQQKCCIMVDMLFHLHTHKHILTHAEFVVIKLCSTRGGVLVERVQGSERTGTSGAVLFLSRCNREGSFPHTFSCWRRAA